MTSRACGISYPHFFVVGCPRSGTTLLQRMLDAHPQLAVSNDTHFIFEPVTGLTPLDPAPDAEGLIRLPLTPGVVELVRGYRTFKRLGLPDDAVDGAAGLARTYTQFLSALYRQFGDHHGKPFVGEKSGRYVNYLPQLHRLFPQARFVHIIRDGRDVALSALEWVAKRDGRGPGRFELWREDPLATCALWWATYIENGRRDGHALGPAYYLEVRYEDLVADAESCLKRVTDFLDLPFAEEMLVYHQGRTRLAAGLSSKKAWLPPTSGLRNWRTAMTAREAELFQALTGNWLTDLGYERPPTTSSSVRIGYAARRRNRWNAELRRRGRLATHAVAR